MRYNQGAKGFPKVYWEICRISGLVNTSLRRGKQCTREPKHRGGRLLKYLALFRLLIPSLRMELIPGEKKKKEPYFTIRMSIHPKAAHLRQPGAIGDKGLPC